MEHHPHHTHHRVHHRKKKISKAIFIVLLVLIFGFAGARFLDGYFSSNSNTATTTPTVTKPKPKPTPKPVTPVTPVAKPFEQLKISVLPEKVVQGDPVLIYIDGLTTTSNIKSFTIDGRPLSIFLYKGYVTALFGADLRAPAGTFPLVLTFLDGKEIKGEVTIGVRPDVRKNFGIPEKFGGDTPQAEKDLIKSLIDESNIINSLPITYTKLWTEDFGSPLEGSLKVDDPFGYTRVTGNSVLSHKGTDLYAPIGTPVYAMNKGVVHLSRDLHNGGGTVIINHGQGLQTVYMHLSVMKVVEGQEVQKGDVIGLTGDTGYVLHPHLHLTVRVWEIAVDAMTFLEIFGEDN